MYAVTPPNMRADYESSTEETREQIVAETEKLIQGGSSRDDVLAMIQGAGWSADFAAWIYTKVKHYGRVQIMPPTEERVRKSVRKFFLWEALAALAAMIVICVVFSWALAPFGLMVIPAWRFFQHWFRPRDTGESKWVETRPKPRKTS